VTTTTSRRDRAEASRARYQERLTRTASGRISTTVEPLGELYWAEGEHQQYLAKNPNGYCNHGFCQVAY
jgi:peptide-methionine (S)-S-oxide reductase